MSSDYYCGLYGFWEVERVLWKRTEFSRCCGYSQLQYVKFKFKDFKFKCKIKKHVLLVSLMCLKLILSSFRVAFVAFAFVPETIRHLTDNHEHWKKAAEDWVRVIITDNIYLYSRLQSRLWCHFCAFVCSMVLSTLEQLGSGPRFSNGG